MPPVLLASILL
jgi:hypothetical protein